MFIPSHVGLPHLRHPRQPRHVYLVLAGLMFITLCLVVMPVLAQVGQTTNPKRVGLFIGNSQYPGQHLPNAAADAKLLAKAFRQLGFDTEVKTDLTRDQMSQVLQAFIKKAQGADAIVLYFAGHGQQTAANNDLLLPVVGRNDSALARDEGGISAKEVSDTLRALNARVTLLIFDACRQQQASGPGVMRGLGRQWLEQAPAATGKGGWLIAYATDENGVAFDGSGRNGPYALALAAALGKRLSIMKQLSEVKNALRAQTSRQLPEFRGDLDADAYFVPQAAPATADMPAPACPYCPQMVSIPAGTLAVGGHGTPVNPIAINRFELGATEVTRAQWQSLMGQAPSNVPHASAQYPVVNISWCQVQEFITKLNAQTGQRYRLPTEAEWEYAAKANQTTRYGWGDQASHDFANYGDEARGGGPFARGKDLWPGLAPVAQFPANRFGLYDMLGNVAEWVDDVPGAKAACQQGRNVPHVVRGGHYLSGDGALLPTFRELVQKDWQRDQIGFRLAR